MFKLMAFCMIVFTLVSCDDSTQNALPTKKSISLMQSCVDKDMAISLEFYGPHRYLSGVSCRVKTEFDKVLDLSDDK